MKDVLWFLRREAAHGLPGTTWLSVSKTHWLLAEAAAGFRGEDDGEPVTGGFGGHGVVGRYQEVELWSPQAYDWDPEYRDAVNRAILDHNTARTSPPPGVAVLWVWTARLADVKPAVGAALDRLYHEGKIGNHPDGGSQGWEWKT